MKAKIENWAKEAYSEYVRITEEHDIGFYQQSPLVDITHSVKVVAMGINPGSGGSFSEMGKGQWNLGELNPPYKHLILGNIRWSDHATWPYWRNVMGLLSEAYPDIIENEQTDCVFTNATFFNTLKAKDVFERLYDKTLPLTIKLIEILSPEIVVCLSPDNFKRMRRFLGNAFKYNEVFGRRLMICEYHGIRYVSIYHTAYCYSTAYKTLVRKSLKIIHDNRTLGAEEISDLLKSSLEEEWSDLNTPKVLQSSRLRKMATDCLTILQEKFPNAKTEKSKLTIPLNDMIHIMVVAHSATQYIYLRHINWMNNIQYDSQEENIDSIYPGHKDISTLLDRWGYSPTKVALGTKPIASYGASSAEELAEAIYREIQDIYPCLNEIFK